MAPQPIVLRDESGREHRVTFGSDGTALVGETALVLQPSPDSSVRVAGAVNALAWTATVDGTRWVFVDGQVFTFEVVRPSERRTRTTAHHGTLMAPMPATVRKILVATGDNVRKGDVLIVLEAMKMELPVRANADARVQAIKCHEGDLVQAGVSLIELED